MDSSVKELYKKVFTIGIPVSIENMIYSLMNFIDVFMVGKENVVLGLGTAAVAGLGFANQIFMIFIVSLFGLNSGGGILAAQYYGKKDYKNLKKCLGITITVGLLFSFLFFLMGLFIPEKIIGIFTSDPKVLKLGANYFRIIALIYPLIGLGYSFNMQLRAIGKNQYSLYSTIIGLCINLVGNYLFINGNLGFPAMGVVGAAIATVIARIVSVFYLIYIIYKNKLPMAGNFQELFKLSWSFIAKALKISLPVFGHEIMWVTGVSMYVIIYGRIGTEATAAIQVVKSISNLVFTLVFGLSSGTAAIIGQEIGAGNEENAYKYAVELLKISLVIGTAVALFVYAICPVVLILMKVDSAIYPLARQIVFSEGILIIIKTTGTLFIVGVLRAGGDTLWTMFADLIPLWTFAIPLTYIAGLKFGLPIALVYLCSGSDELLKMPFCIQRLKSRKWINNLVKTS
ncbi:MATE efflux family protein [Leptotrichia sp. oral taxon 215 str. W9775]|jgi:MATE efflux family protein|uniref:MATE family efflux transporter n=1 Tax=Leptotrichia sp. oral taxon 215 TaxID=712359 RepID=UPI0003AE60A8|nr:MATE family efflux transporter [Leptotrichia sp. oral taxon 215]ERK65889.1 MATE efflux family protein [Leptotrichia sp. oral taxon 215 str. W9775]